MGVEIKREFDNDYSENPSKIKNPFKNLLEFEKYLFNLTDEDNIGELSYFLMSNNETDGQKKIVSSKPLYQNIVKDTFYQTLDSNLSDEWLIFNQEELDELLENDFFDNYKLFKESSHYPRIYPMLEIYTFAKLQSIAVTKLPSEMTHDMQDIWTLDNFVLTLYDLKFYDIIADVYKALGMHWFINQGNNSAIMYKWACHAIDACNISNNLSKEKLKQDLDSLYSEMIISFTVNDTLKENKDILDFVRRYKKRFSIIKNPQHEKIEKLEKQERELFNYYSDLTIYSDFNMSQATAKTASKFKTNYSVIKQIRDKYKWNTKIDSNLGRKNQTKTSRALKDSSPFSDRIMHNNFSEKRMGRRLFISDPYDSQRLKERKELRKKTQGKIKESKKQKPKVNSASVKFDNEMESRIPLQKESIEKIVVDKDADKFEFDDYKIEDLLQKIRALEKENQGLSEQLENFKKGYGVLQMQIKQLQTNDNISDDDKVENICNRIYSLFPNTKGSDEDLEQFSEILDFLMDSTKKDLQNSLALINNFENYDLALLELTRSVEREFIANFISPFQKSIYYHDIKEPFCDKTTRKTQKYCITHNSLLVGHKPTMGNIPFLGHAVLSKKAIKASNVIEAFSIFLDENKQHFADICKAFEEYKIGTDNFRIIDIRNGIAHGDDEIKVDKDIYQEVNKILFEPPIAILLNIIRYSMRNN